MASKKNEVVIKRTDSLLVTVTPPSDQMDLGHQINYFNDVVKQSAQIGCTAAVITGVLLVKAHQQNEWKFQSWLEANTAVSQRTSYNYMNAAKRTLGTQIVEELAARGTVEIAEKVTAAMVKLKIESKPLTELYCDVGIVKRTPSNMGGAREGAGRPRKGTAAELAAAAETLSGALGAEAVFKQTGDLYEAGVVKGGFGNCSVQQLEGIARFLQNALRACSEILSSRAKKGKGGAK